LGIETSCDETAAAVVEGGRRTVSSVVASQIATHARYGGVVPELASREHLRAIVPVVRAALEQAGIGFKDLDAVAVTAGPGLAGALLVGITYAKALAYAIRRPLIAVNHLEGHIHAVLLREREELDSQQQDEPVLALVVSGGHTHLYLARPLSGLWSYELIGRTVDDAAGEAYDKVAKLLGLGYPGGPWIDALAQFGDPGAVPFSFAQVKAKAHLRGKTARTKGAETSPIADLDSHFLFSFSGIKTAVLRYVDVHGLRDEAERRAGQLYPAWTEKAGNAAGSAVKLPQTKDEALALCTQITLDLMASFQHAVIGDLMKKAFGAAERLGTDRMMVTGGVAANRELRERFSREAVARRLKISFPTKTLSTDNAAMIAAAAWPRYEANEFAPADLSGDPALKLA